MMCEIFIHCPCTVNIWNSRWFSTNLYISIR